MASLYRNSDTYGTITAEYSPAISAGPLMSSKKLSDYKVVIAYDFGTTYSGAAYAFTHTETPEVFDVLKWPHKAGNFFPKVPTVALYNRGEENSPLIAWGHGAKKAILKPYATQQYVMLSNFKLHLDENLNLAPLENGLQPVQVVADYLAALHQHTLQEITRGFAKNYHPDTFRYCLTVPALWSDKAKNTMRQAALKAGLISAYDPLDRLVLISEPEAAALYCEETMSDRVQLKQGDRILVCDAGGGTVDLIVFQVELEPKKELKEITKGIGESCGSVFLDDRYLQLLRRKLGDQIVDKIPPRAMSDLMDQFIDNIKPEFDGVDDHYVTLPRSVDIASLPKLDDDDCGHLDEGTLKLSADELKTFVFDPVVDKVLSLIEQQYNQIKDGRLTYLFLVGGFGSSNYLYQRVQQAYQDKVEQIICPADMAARAVVRGAVYYALHPRIITSRVSRRTYGINAGLPFDEKRDPPASRVVRPDGSVRCTTRFLVFVKKHDVLPVDHCIKEEMFVYYGTVKRTDIMLYATENEQVPRYYDEPGVKHVASISVPIPEMPGVMHGERIAYTVRMYFGLTEIAVEADFHFGHRICHRIHLEF